MLLFITQERAKKPDGALNRTRACHSSVDKEEGLKGEVWAANDGGEETKNDEAILARETKIEKVMMEEEVDPSMKREKQS